MSLHEVPSSSVKNYISEFTLGCCENESKLGCPVLQCTTLHYITAQYSMHVLGYWWWRFWVLSIWSTVTTHFVRISGLWREVYASIGAWHVQRITDLTDIFIVSITEHIIYFTQGLEDDLGRRQGCDQVSNIVAWRNNIYACAICWQSTIFDCIPVLLSSWSIVVINGGGDDSFFFLWVRLRRCFSGVLYTWLSDNLAEKGLSN